MLSNKSKSSLEGETATAKKKIKNPLLKKTNETPEESDRKKQLSKSFENLEIQLKELERQLSIKSLNAREIERQIQEKKELLFASKRRTQGVHSEIKEAQKRLYDSTKTIKVTDDDYSTIQAKLAQLSGKISSLPIQIKPFLKKEFGPIRQFFMKKWPDESLESLFQDTLDYALVALLVEKLVMEFIVHHILCCKIHLNDRVNQAFSAIEEKWTRSDHAHWIPALRLKCARATHDVVSSGKSVWVEEINQRKKAVVDELFKELSAIYNEDKEIQSRLEKIVDIASDLSLPMRGQEDAMIIRFLNKEDRVIPSQVKAQYRCIGNDKIILGISPVFLAKAVHDGNEDENMESYAGNCTVVYSGKAIW